VRPRRPGAGFFLSIHHDSVKEEYQQPWTWNGREPATHEGFAGFSLFVSRLNPRLDESLACASAIGAALRRAGLPVATHHGVSSAGVERPWADEANGVYFYDNLVVLKGATIPAVLLEAGVIVNRGRGARPGRCRTRRALTAAAVAGAGLRRDDAVTP
jgi:N-acetylmuramoyl-L-alanine amidase